MLFISWDGALKLIKFCDWAFPTLNCVSLLIYSISALLSICFYSCWCLVIFLLSNGQYRAAVSDLFLCLKGNYLTQVLSLADLAVQGDKLLEVNSWCINFVLSFDRCIKIVMELYVLCSWCTSVCISGLQYEVSSPTPQNLLQMPYAEKNFQYLLLKPILLVLFERFSPSPPQ